MKFKFGFNIEEDNIFEAEVYFAEAYSMWKDQSSD